MGYGTSKPKACLFHYLFPRQGKSLSDYRSYEPRWLHHPRHPYIITHTIQHLAAQVLLA